MARKIDIKDIFPREVEDKSGFSLDAEMLENLPEGYLLDFKKQLLAHPDYEKIKDNYIINEERNILVHIFEKIPLSETDDLTVDQRFFYPLCSKSEIRQIFNPQTAEDYLLKYRAEQIIDSPRLSRVVNSIRRKRGRNWNFSNYLRSDQFKMYLALLPGSQKAKCQNIPFGTIYMQDANGQCMKSPKGNIIVISAALRSFLYYMNLFHFGSQLGIQPEDTFHAFLIAVRTMLGTESLDFEIDPRGEIPDEIQLKINEVTDWQMLFIIGHEFAHHYLNHLKTSTIGIFKYQFVYSNKETRFYNYSEELELEADFHSVSVPILKRAYRTELCDGAFLFFIWLDLYETVENYIFPPTSAPKTHPDPLDRLWELRKRLNKSIGLTTNDLKKIIDNYRPFKEFLLNEILPFRTEEIERYGSFYLPSFKKEIKADRIYF